VDQSLPGDLAQELSDQPLGDRPLRGRLLRYIAGRLALVGVGRSILSRDCFMATGIFTYYSLLAGIAMLGVDLAYTVIDPKIRY